MEIVSKDCRFREFTVYGQTWRTFSFHDKPLGSGLEGIIYRLIGSAEANHCEYPWHVLKVQFQKCFSTREGGHLVIEPWKPEVQASRMEMLSNAGINVAGVVLCGGKFCVSEYIGGPSIGKMRKKPWSFFISKDERKDVISRFFGMQALLIESKVPHDFTRENIVYEVVRNGYLLPREERELYVVDV
ncbi:MAG: hypothetical protein ABIE74_10000 [Pseudomonadota bacterium]